MTSLLRFTDARGIEWEVWEVGARPQPVDRAPQPAVARWLCFESPTERRRLSDYPPRWHVMTPQELDALCQSARPARRGAPELSKDGVSSPHHRDRR